MKKQTVNSVRLGAFVIIGTLALISGLYLIGKKKDIFHSSMSLMTDFNNVGGLMIGNNVRFNGITVGTVKEIYPISDTVIRVEFSVDETYTPYIKKSALVSIGTDGLLGNKIINISPGENMAGPVNEGDLLFSMDPVQMDNAMRTLSITNDNLRSITDRLKGVADKLDNNNSLLNLLTDSNISENVKTAIVRFSVTGNNTARITGDLSDIVRNIRAGKGTLGALLIDTSISAKLDQTIISIQSISDSVAFITGNFKEVSYRLKEGEGIGALLTDTMFVHNLNRSMDNIGDASGNFNENMEALKHSWPFRKYFRKKKKL